MQTPRPLLALALLGALACSCSSDSRGPARPPHVLLVSIDTLRADHLSCHGYSRPTSPRLDALAASGARFERTFASSSWTLPSHMTIFTGLPVSGHGICDDRLWTRSDEAGEALAVPLAGTFLPEVLGAAGYACGGFYTWKYLEPRFGFGAGFDVYERLGHTFYSWPPVAEKFEALRAAGDTEGLKALAAQYPDLFDATHQSSPETIERALEWIDSTLDENPDVPLFTFVHLFDVHDPYTPPAPYNTLFDPDYTGAINGKNVTSANSPVQRDMDPRDLEHLIALYDGGIAWVDSQVGRLLDELDERGILEDTLVMVTSDHGEEFFEHGGKTHRGALYVESVHVPWIVAWPGHIEAGLEIGGASGLVDLAPTIYGLLGLRAPAGSLGRDLGPVLRGEAQIAPAIVLSELLLFDGEGPPRRRVGLLSEEEHILLGARGDEPWQGARFALDSDPGEQSATVAFRLEEEVAAGVRDTLAKQRAALAESRALSATRPAGGWGPLSARELAELAAVGYAGPAPTQESGAPRGGWRACFDGCCW
jgi:arylsulfatase A-like enzyme